MLSFAKLGKMYLPVSLCMQAYVNLQLSQQKFVLKNVASKKKEEWRVTRSRQARKTCRAEYRPPGPWRGVGVYLWSASEGFQTGLYS